MCNCDALLKWHRIFVIDHHISCSVLNLQACGSLQILPLGITRLCNLRRVGLHQTPINKVPKGIGTLYFLNDLEGFPAIGVYDNSTRMQDGWKLEELVYLAHYLDMQGFWLVGLFCQKASKIDP